MNVKIDKQTMSNESLKKLIKQISLKEQNIPLYPPLKRGNIKPIVILSHS